MSHPRSSHHHPLVPGQAGLGFDAIDMFSVPAGVRFACIGVAVAQSADYEADPIPSTIIILTQTVVWSTCSWK
jgi:hypothetical protein